MSVASTLAALDTAVTEATTERDARLDAFQLDPDDIALRDALLMAEGMRDQLVLARQKIRHLED